MSKLDVTTPTDTTVRFTRRFSARPVAVFRAFTTADLMLKWYGADTWPPVHVESEPRAGGHYRMVWAHADGRQMAVTGRYVDVDPPHRIVGREIFDEDWTGGDTVSTTLFEAIDGGTKITMTIEYSSRKARDGALATPMAEGMEASFANLDKLIEDPSWQEENG